MSSAGSQTTGTADALYDLTSVLYHALEAAQTYDKYAQDAQQTGNQQLAQFFQEVKQQNQQCADKAKQLLGQQISGNGQMQG